MRMLKTARMSSASRYMKPTHDLSTIDDVPSELIIDILAQVGSASLVDLFNAKLSCKSFYGHAEDKSVYQQVSLDKLPIVSWRSLSNEERVFLKKCEESKHPDVMYRKALIGYFGKGKHETARAWLQKARESGHIESLYLTGIILLLSGDDESISSGIKLLGCMTKSKYWKTKFRRCRKNLIKTLQTMWIHPHVVRRPSCCSREVNHGTKIGWDGEIVSTSCEACNADKELEFISDYLRES